MVHVYLTSPLQFVISHSYVKVYQWEIINIIHRSSANHHEICRQVHGWAGAGSSLGTAAIGTVVRAPRAMFCHVIACMRMYVCIGTYMYTYIVIDAMYICVISIFCIYIYVYRIYIYMCVCVYVPICIHGTHEWLQKRSPPIVSCDRKVAQLIGMGFTEQQAHDREGWWDDGIHPAADTWKRTCKWLDMDEQHR